MVKKLLIVISIAVSCIIIRVSQSPAHAPHDVVADIQLSPTYSSDKTIFALVYWKLFISTNGGYDWHFPSRGLCSHHKISLALSPAFSIDKTLFVSCVEGELHRSRDAGQSWVRCSGGLPRLGRFIYLLTAPHSGTDHTVVALDAGGTIYQSQDGGEHWKRVFEEHCTISAQDGVDNRIMVATDAGILYVSDNGGTNWKEYARYPAGGKITCIELPSRFSQDGLFFIGTEKEGVVRVERGGTVFEKSKGLLAGTCITSLDSSYEAGRLTLFASTWHEAVFRSEDNGDSWSHHGNGLFTNKQADEYIAPHFSKITAADDSTLFLGGFCGLFRSPDKGCSWYKIETLLDLIVGIDISPLSNSSPTLALATYGRGIYTADTDTLSWKVNNCGLVNTRIGTIAYSPAFAQDKTVFAGSYGNIVKSTDGGDRWSPIPAIPPRFSPEGAEYRIKARLRRAIFESGSPLLKKFLAKVVLSWLKINIQHKPWIPLVFAFSPSFAVDGTVFAGMSPQGLLRSLDGGSTFSLIWNGSGSPVQSLVISPAYAADRTLFASLPGGIYRSRNGGENWEPVGGSFDLGSAQLVISPDYPTDHTLFAGGASGLFRTRDEGETWERLSLGAYGTGESVSGVAISPFYATDRQLLVQIKGGNLLICHDFQDSFEVFPGTSAEGGYEFSHLHGRDTAPLIKFSPNYGEDRTVFAVSRQKLVKSIDGGMTWKELPRPLRYESEAPFQEWLALPVFLKGQWVSDYRKEYSNSCIISSDEPGSEASLRFAGNGVTWLGTQGPDRGIARVFIDGIFRAEVDQYSEKRKILVELFSSGGLSSDFHEITITADGSRNERSSGTRIDIDAFDVTK